MVEIIALISLTRKIGFLAEQKGQKASKWKWYVVLAWLGFEVLGGMIGYLIFGYDRVVCALVGYAFAIPTYFIIKRRLQKMPDQEDLLSHIGTDMQSD